MPPYRNVGFKALILLGSVLSADTAHGQIRILTEVGGKEISCMYSGLSSALKDCGTQSSWYTYVFVGSISHIAPTGDEETVAIAPEEVFLGSPASSLTVVTSQAACLPKIVVGDRWLFFLREQQGRPIILDAYANQSRPVSTVPEPLETLCRLQSIGNAALLRGNVQRFSSPEAKPVPAAIVTAARMAGGEQFTSQTGSNGQYEFQPLPPGKYTLTVAPVESFRAYAGEVELASGACRDVTLQNSPHSIIAGHVKLDSSSAGTAQIVLISADGSWFQTARTDQEGRFAFESLPPGRYVIGMNPGVHADGSGAGIGVKSPEVSPFYPNAVDRSNAVVIELGADDQRTGIDFVNSPR